MYLLIIIYLSILIPQLASASESAKDWSCKDTSWQAPQPGHIGLEKSKKKIVNASSASALIVHGLNGSPHNMNSLVEAATKLNMNTYHVFLRGHRGSIDEFKVVTKVQWMEDLFRGYCQLEALGKPIVYIGYSLGGLLGPYFLENQNSANFKAMVLLAPGIVVKSRVRLLRFFRLLGKKWIIPKRGPDVYYANRGSPVQAWLESFNMMDSLETTQNSKFDIPTLVAIDPEDKLISYKKLKKFVAQRKLNNNWSFFEVHSKSKNHHMIFTKESLAEKEWDSLIESIKLVVETINN